MTVYTRIRVVGDQWIVDDQEIGLDHLEKDHTIQFDGPQWAWGFSVVPSFLSGVRVVDIFFDLENKDFFKSPYWDSSDPNFVGKILELRSDIVSRVRNSKLDDLGIWD